MGRWLGEVLAGRVKVAEASAVRVAQPAKPKRESSQKPEPAMAAPSRPGGDLEDFLL